MNFLDRRVAERIVDIALRRSMTRDELIGAASVHRGLARFYGGRKEAAKAMTQDEIADAYERRAAAQQEAVA